MLVIWALYTHAYEKFMHAPRLTLHSPVPGCGKTTLFAFLDAIIRAALMVVALSMAAIFRKMDAQHPTILFDEADKYIHAGNDVHAILNAGHNRKSAKVLRVMGEDMHVEEYNLFGPVAFALKGKHLPPDLAERSIRVNMQRAPRMMEPFTLEHEKTLRAMREVFAKWAKDAELEGMVVEMPTDLINRGADNWRPLLTVAKAVGGDWYDRIKAAAVGYEQKQESTDHNMMLLAHLRAIWPEGQDFASSESLIYALNKNEEWPWGEYNRGDGLTTHGLAKKLNHFGIKPEQRRLERMNGEPTSVKQRGYWRRDLEPAWADYGIEADSVASVASLAGEVAPREEGLRLTI